MSRKHHGTYQQRGMHHIPNSVHAKVGRFGRLFPTLPAAHFSEAFLHELGKKGGVMDAGTQPGSEALSTTIPAGFTFLGQFIDHDITLDVTSSLERKSDPEAVQNFRTPVLELDSVYGQGPEATPFLYDQRDGFEGKLLVSDDGIDLPRNSQAVALIGDPRNDENFFISQLHLAFLRFHNTMVDYVAENEYVRPENRFERAQELVRWHYQWIIYNEFLPLMIGSDLYWDIRDNGLKLYQIRSTSGTQYYSYVEQPFIPIEFAAAAYRFGHTQVNQQFWINGRDVALFRREGDPASVGVSPGFTPPPAEMTAMWESLFAINGDNPPMFAGRLDTLLATALLDLPFIGDADRANGFASLATRNLLRGNTFSLPSGERIAYALNETPLSRAELGLDDVFAAVGETYQGDSPLWYYILREAALRGSGEHLGPVGGRIVGETLVGLLMYDQQSYLNQDPHWQPIATVSGDDGSFTMADLLRFAGVTERPQTQRTHIVKPGESLASISVIYYGTQTRFQDIFNANRDRIGDDPRLILPGTELVIPQ